MPSLSIPPPACAPTLGTSVGCGDPGQDLAPSHRTAFGADGSSEAAQGELGMVGQGPGKGLQGMSSTHKGTVERERKRL